MEIKEGKERPFETKTLIGNQLGQLPEKTKLELGQQVSKLIAEHRDTMLQYTPEQVKQIMDEDRAVVVIDSSGNNRMCAFAQLSPWRNGSEQILAIEFRTWISNKHGGGLPALMGAVELSRERYPGISIYAVIEENNSRGQRIVRQAGAKKVPMPSSIKVELKAGDQPAPVITYDLTNVKAK